MLFLSEAATGGVLYRQGVFKNFAKFTGKHLCQSLFYKVAAHLFLQNTPGRLLFLTVMANFGPLSRGEPH